MSGKQMEGDNRQRRKAADEARETGQQASEASASLGSSKQIDSPKEDLSHQEKLDLKREGKQENLVQGSPPEARPRSGDEDASGRDR